MLARMDARLRLAKTGSDVLVSNLRGEVGEALTAWVLLRHFMASAKKLQTDDLAFLWLMRGKLENELIARLSELADKKVGRTNFYFASLNGLPMIRPPTSSRYLPRFKRATWVEA
jgi:hypothetical protein